MCIFRYDLTRGYNVQRLQWRESQACEFAESPKEKCKCRCGGKLHGAKRTKKMDLLPGDDPHYAEESEQKRQISLFDAEGVSAVFI